MERRLHEMNDLVRIRNSFCKRLFILAIRAYCRTVSRRWRAALEVAVATKALVSLLILLYIHSNYVVSPATCVSEISKHWQPDGSVLRIEVRQTSPGQSTWCREIPDSCNGTWIEEWGVTNVEDHMEPCRSIGKAVDGEKLHSTFDDLIFRERNGFFGGRGSETSNGSDVTGKFGFLLGDENDSSLAKSESSWLKDVSFDHCTPLLVAMEYSLEYGYLRLPHTLRTRHNISIWRAILDPDKNSCFRGGLAQWLLANFVGYDDMFMVAFKHMAGDHSSHGYLKNVMTGMTYKFVDLDYPWVGILVALVLMIIFTVSVSLVLRQTHEQVFNFIVSIQRSLETNSPISFPFGFMFTILLAVIGLENTMTEFFTDSSLSIWIILMVWLADHFHSICCQSRIGKKYWWRFFYLYQFMFYCYHHVFNGQFSSIAFIVFVLLVEHSMLFFLHHYEIPALPAAGQQINRNPARPEMFDNRSQDGGAGNRQTSEVSRNESRQEVEGEELRHRQEAGREGNTGVQ